MTRFVCRFRTVLATLPLLLGIAAPALAAPEGTMTRAASSASISASP